MNKQELKELIKDNCKYSESSIDYVVDNTEVELIPTFKCLTGELKIHLPFSNVDKYINYFFNQVDNSDILIANNDIDTSNLLTKFKVDDVVYYLDKSLYCLIRGEITSIHNYISDRAAYSTVCLKRLDEDVDFVCTTITNNDLFLTIDEAIGALVDNTFRVEQIRKQQKYNQLVEEELSRFNTINDE